MTELDMLSQADRRLLRPSTGAGWRSPMLASLTDARIPDDGWLFERKLDGVRALAVRGGGDDGGGDTAAPTLWSRNHKPLDAGFGEIVAALAECGPSRFVVDGELVAFDGTSTSFAMLAKRNRPSGSTRVDGTGVTVYYYLFDLLELAGVDVSSLPLRARKALLRKAFRFAEPLRYAEHRDGGGAAYFDHASANGWEGVIAKRADSPYRGGRSGDWLKFKVISAQEFVVGGYTEPAGTRTHFGALLVGYYDGDRLRYAGRVGSGFDQRALRTVHSAMVELAVDTSPFDDVGDSNGGHSNVGHSGGGHVDLGAVDLAAELAGRTAHWVRPHLVVQVGFAEWTPDGRLRHPRYQGVRLDKRAADVVRE